MKKTYLHEKAENGQKNKYVVNCWAYISIPYVVEAANEDEARKLAWSQFEYADLNKADLGDYGTDVISECING